MFEDRECQDPLSRSEKYEDRNLPRRDQRKASPERKRDTPGIKVIIKEEEDGWTVRENHDSYRSGADREAAAAAATAAAHSSLPQLKAYGKDRVKSRQRFNSVERHSDPESRSPALSGHSSSARESRQQRHSPGESDARPEISCAREKAPGSENVDECNNTVRETSPGHRWSLSSCHRTQVDSARGAAWSVDVRQSTSLQTEAEPHPTRAPALCQTDSSEHRPLPSRGRKMATSSLDGQTLRLTVRLQSGEEEEQEDEIGGLINSDGEVVEWDANAHQQSDCTESPQYSKGDGSSESQPHGQNQRERSSPTLIMEVVSVGEDEEMDEGEEGKKVAKMKTYHGKRHRRKSKDPQIKAVNSDAEKDVSAKPVKRRARRNISEIPLMSAADIEAEPEMPRRTRRKTRFIYMGESEDLSPKHVRRVTAKRPYRKRKDSKQSAEGGANSGSGKRGPGRKTFRVPLEIPTELLRAPKEKMEYLCSVCGKEFPHAYKLERHELVHTGEKPYNCSVCGRGFNQKGNLKTHYKIHLGRKGALEFEDEMNPVPPELSDYLKSLPGESKIRSAFHCLECGKDCESQAALQAHYITTHALTAAESASIHGGTQLIFCTRCGLHFLDNEQLEEHMKAHVKEKRYSCPDCGKMFINESYIQVHRRIHTGERPFLCSQCGRGFHTASSLKLHELHHSQERPFACNICGKTFLINSYLTAHYQTHLKERPFICNVCGKGYSRAEELKVHHRHHTGERPFKCEECGKSFIYRQGLKQHERTHGGKRIGPTRQLGRPKQLAQMDV